MSNDDASATTAPHYDPILANLTTYLEWTGYPKWSAQEAACLLLGLNPDILDPPNRAVGVFYEVALERANYQRMRQLAQRAVKHRQLTETTPAHWVEWARARLLDVPIPPALVEALELRAEQARQGNPTKTPRPSKLETEARYAAWQARANELFRQEKKTTVTAVAKKICKDPELNPPDTAVDAGTIRRHLRLPD